MKNQVSSAKVLRGVFISLYSLFAVFNLPAQQPSSLSIFNHATTLPPNGISGPWHPGIDIGISTRYREKTSSRSFLHWKLGYYYHRLVHHGIQLYGEYTRQYTLFSKFGLGWSAGLGYVHTIDLHEKFILEDSGEYKRTGKLGKPHAQVSVGAALHYPMGKVSPFLQYRVRMVTPFVNEYVPLLPSTSWHMGFYYGLQTDKKPKS